MAWGSSWGLKGSLSLEERFELCKRGTVSTNATLASGRHFSPYMTIRDPGWTLAPFEPFNQLGPV